MQQDRFLRFTLLDKDGDWLGVVGDYDYLTVTERWHALGTGEISVSAAHVKLPQMIAAGARYVVELIEPLLVGENRVQVSRGVLRDPVGSFMPGGSVRFQLEDDWRALQNILIRVKPGQQLEAVSLSDPAQSNEATPPAPTGTDTGRTGYWNYGGGSSPVPAEDAVLNILSTHLRQRWFDEFGFYRFTIPVSAGRGGNVRDLIQQFRFCTIAEAITPLLDFANLGLMFNQFSIPSGTATESAVIWEPITWPITLTPDSGTVVDGEWSLTSPTATDIVVGGPGEMASRAFAGTEDAAVKTEYSDLIEVFRNATGAPLPWPTTLAEEYRVAKYYMLLGPGDGVSAADQAAFARFLQAAGSEALTEGTPTSGVSIELQESQGFRFSGIPAFGGTLLPRTGFATGDMVTVSPSAQTAVAGLTFTDRITATTLTQTAKGLTITPQVGKVTGNPDRLMADTVRAIADSSRRQAIAQ